MLLPDGIDVSVVALPGVSSGTTTRLSRPQDAEPPAPAESTLMSSRPIRTVAMVVGGGSIFGTIVLGGVLLLLVIAVLTALLMQPDDPPVATVPVEQPAPPPPLPAPTPVPVAAERVEVTLSSSPSSASVERDGVLRGTTPFIIRLDEGEEMTVEVIAPGHHSQKIVLSSSVASPKVTLKRRSRPSSSPKPAPAPAPAPAPVPEPAPAPEPEPAPQPTPKPAYDGVDMKDPFGDE